MPEKRRSGRGNTGVWWRLIRAAARTGEDMFVAPDARSVHRGSRRAPRTEVFRPCLLRRTGDSGEESWEGIVLDLNRYGFRVRTFASLAVEDIITLQLMRDEEFKYPLSGLLNVRIVRKTEAAGGLIDYGMELIVEPLSPMARPARGLRPQASPSRPRPAPRMHLADYLNKDRDGKIR